MVGHGGSSAGSYLADPTSPIPSHCASIVATSTVRVNYFFLLFCCCRSNTTFKLKQRVRVCELWTAEAGAGGVEAVSEVSRSADAPERSFVLGWPTTNVLATFPSPAARDNWLAKLRA